jgi:hypothetical protein
MMTDGHADGGGHHGGGVVDAVADIERLCFGGFGADEGEFFLGALLRVDLGDADLIGEVANFGFAVAGDDHDAVEVMPWCEVIHKAAAFGTRGIAEAQGGGVVAVDDDDALESAYDGRELIGAGKVLRYEFVAAGDLDLMTRHGADQTLAGLFADGAGFGQGEALRLRGGEDGA